MNVFIWMLAGATLGWASYSFLGFSEGRGKAASMVVGAMGGILGGKLIAPMLTAPPAVPGDFSMAALFIAGLVASTALVIANMVYNRWDI